MEELSNLPIFACIPVILPEIGALMVFFDKAVLALTIPE